MNVKLAFIKALMLFTGALVAVSTASVSPAAAQFGNYRWDGLIGKAVDESGAVVPELGVRLKPVIATGGELKLKTTKRGEFLYPRLELLVDGYQFGLDSTEWYIKSFSFVCRRGTGEIAGEQKGNLTPRNQAGFPVIKHRSHTEVELVVARIADYQGGAPNQPGAAPGAAPAKKPGEMTPVEQADEAEAMGDFAGAATALSKALEATPNDPDLMWRRAEMLARAGESSDALKLGNRVLAVAPDRKGVRLKMAAWLIDTAEYETAVALLKKEIELDPENEMVAKGMFVALQGSGAENAEIEKAAQKWVELSKENPEALIALAGMKVKRGDFAGAEALYRKVAAQDPGNADRMFYNVGVSIMNKEGVSEDDRRRAVDAFKQAVALNPRNEQAFLQLGYTYAGLGQMDEAKQAWREFLKIAPNDPQAADVKDMLK